MMSEFNYQLTSTSTLVCKGSLVIPFCSIAPTMMMQCGDWPSMMWPCQRLFRVGTFWEVLIWRRSRSSWSRFVHQTWRRRRCRRPCFWFLVKTTSRQCHMTGSGTKEDIGLARVTRPTTRRMTMFGMKIKEKKSIQGWRLGRQRIPWWLRAGVCRRVWPGCGILSRRRRIWGDARELRRWGLYTAYAAYQDARKRFTDLIEVGPWLSSSGCFGWSCCWQFGSRYESSIYESWTWWQPQRWWEERKR